MCIVLCYASTLYFKKQASIMHVFNINKCGISDAMLKMCQSVESNHLYYMCWYCAAKLSHHIRAKNTQSMDHHRSHLNMATVKRLLMQMSPWYTIHQHHHISLDQRGHTCISKFPFHVMASGAICWLFAANLRFHKSMHLWRDISNVYGMCVV